MRSVLSLGIAAPTCLPALLVATPSLRLLRRVLAHSKLVVVCLNVFRKLYPLLRIRTLQPIRFHFMDTEVFNIALHSTPWEMRPNTCVHMLHRFTALTHSAAPFVRRCTVEHDTLQFRNMSTQAVLPHGRLVKKNTITLATFSPQNWVPPTSSCASGQGQALHGRQQQHRHHLGRRASLDGQHKKTHDEDK